MSTTLITLVAALVAVTLAMMGLGVKVLVKKNGEFKRHCSSIDPYTGERSGCVCGKTIADKCDHSPKYHPLEVNRELLRECGSEAANPHKPATIKQHKEA